MTMSTSLPGTQNPWEHPVTEGPPPPVSERLVRALEAQMLAEADDAVCAARLADTSGDRAVNVLLELIVEDSQRHQELLHRMIRRLRQELDFVEAPKAMPVPGEHPFEGVDEAPSSLRSLIRNKQEGARHLRHLAHQDSDLYAGFVSLLLETFARDGEKNVHLLRYLLRQVEAQ